MKKKILDNINYILMCIIIVGLPLSIILKIYSEYIPFLNNLCLYYYQILWILIPFQILIYIYNLKQKKFKINIFDIIVYILLILIMVSTNLAIDLDTAIWGAYLRNEGFLTILSYYLLFLNCKDCITKPQIKKIINALIILGLAQFVFSCLQVFIRGPYQINAVNNIHYMALGFTSNPNFLGSFMVLLLSLTTAMYLIEKNKYYLIVSIIFFINLILAQSTGPFFAYIFTLIFMIIVLNKKKKIDLKKPMVFIGILFITFLLTANISELIFKNVFHDKIQSSYTIKGDLINTLNIANPLYNNLDGSKDELIENYGSGRFTIWKNSLKIFPNYPLFGTGPDNFGYAYSKINSYSGVYYDKAHNEYIQILVTQGIFVFLTYMLFLGLIFFKTIKSKDNLTLLLLFSFVGYSVQAFMNISIASVAPFNFIIMGLLINSLNKENSKIN